MRKYMVGLLVVVVSLLSTAAISAERAFSWTQAPASGDYIQVRLEAYHLSKYLAECEVNRPEIVNEVKMKLDEGGYYRKATKDQKGRATTLTVNVNPDYMLRIVTWRDEPCPDCKGTGIRAKPFDKISKRVDVNFKCLKCDGKGKLENFTNERYFMLSPEDFENPDEGRAIMRDKAYANAPQGAQAWVERLISQNPRERLDACIWLDQHYVSVGDNFQDIMPMLKKARFYDSNEKKKIMVWQFWAGKDLPDQQNYAFYRIYADTKTGKITRKGFYSGR